MKYKVITGNAAKLLQHLSEERKQFFSFQDIMQFMTDASKPYVKELLQDLVDRELILRLRRGQYVVVPYDVSAKDYFPDWRVVASRLAKDTTDPKSTRLNSSHS